MSEHILPDTPESRRTRFIEAFNYAARAWELYKLLEGQPFELLFASISSVIAGAILDSVWIDTIAAIARLNDEPASRGHRHLVIETFLTEAKLSPIDRRLAKNTVRGMAANLVNIVHARHTMISHAEVDVALSLKLKPIRHAEIESVICAMASVVQLVQRRHGLDESLDYGILQRDAKVLTERLGRQWVARSKKRPEQL